MIESEAGGAVDGELPIVGTTAEGEIGCQPSASGKVRWCQGRAAVVRLMPSALRVAYAEAVGERIAGVGCRSNRGLNSSQACSARAAGGDLNGAS